MISLPLVLSAFRRLLGFPQRLAKALELLTVSAFQSTPDNPKRIVVQNGVDRLIPDLRSLALSLRRKPLLLLLIQDFNRRDRLGQQRPLRAHNIPS